MSSTRWSIPASSQIRLQASAVLTTSSGRPSSMYRSPDTPRSRARMQPRAMSSAKTQLTGNQRYDWIRWRRADEQHPVEAGPAQGVAGHRRGAEDGARDGW